MRQLTALGRYNGHHHVSIQFNEPEFDVYYAAYFVYDDGTQELIVLQTYMGFISRRQIINDAPTGLTSVILGYQVLGDSVNRNSSPSRRSRQNSQAFIFFGIVRYIGTIVRSNLALSSLVLFQNNFLGKFFCVLGDHVAWDGNCVLRLFRWVGGYVNDPVVVKDRRVHQPYGRPQFLLHLKDTFRNIPQQLRDFIGFLHDDDTDRIGLEQDESASLSINENQSYVLSHAVYDNPNFQHYGVICRRSTTIVGPTGTGNKSTIMKTFRQFT